MRYLIRTLGRRHRFERWPVGYRYEPRMKRFLSSRPVVPVVNKCPYIEYTSSHGRLIQVNTASNSITHVDLTAVTLWGEGYVLWWMSACISVLRRYHWWEVLWPDGGSDLHEVRVTIGTIRIDWGESPHPAQRVRCWSGIPILNLQTICTPRLIKNDVRFFNLGGSYLPAYLWSKIFHFHVKWRISRYVY